MNVYKQLGRLTHQCTRIRLIYTKIVLGYMLQCGTLKKYPPPSPPHYCI